MAHWRDAFRIASRQPFFTLLIVTMLTLGIGGATAMFSAVRGVLLKPLPYERPEELVWMYGAFRLNDSAAISPPDFVDYRARNQVFESLGAMVIGPSMVTVAKGSGPERLNMAYVSAGLITTLGVSPMVGRDFLREEESSTAAQPVVISERLWREQLGASPDALGRTVRVDDKVRTIVGVMPAEFALPFDAFIRLTDPVDLYAPLTFNDSEFQVRRFHFLRVIGRLRPGVSIREAQANMDTIARQLEAAYRENETWKLRLLSLHERVVGDLRQVLFVLFGAVLLLLVVACANVAGLLLARGVVRQNELALRAALGATRRGVLAQLLVESLALASMGTSAGLVLGWWLVQLMKRLGPVDLPRLTDINIDLPVVAFSVLLAAVTTLLFGAAPAMHASRQDPADSLRQGGRVGGGRSRTRMRNTFVVAQIAVSCTLLAAAGLFMQSLWRLQSVDPGFNARGVVVSHLSLPPDTFDSDGKVAAWYESLLERLSSAAGVEAAALASAPPLVGANDTAVHREGNAPASDADRRFAQLRDVDGDYFGAVGMRMTSGRPFTPADRSGAPPVVVITEEMARQFFPQTNPVGQRLVIDLGEPTAAEIIGVVSDARLFGQASAAPATMYLTSRQWPRPATHVVLRMATPALAGPLLRDTVRSLDRNVAVGRIQSMEQMLSESLDQPRFRTVLAMLFAAIALALTLGGLYGSVSWAVAQRTREFGIRSAVGARPRQLLTLVLRQGMWLVALGALLGLAGAYACGRFVQQLLYETRPFEPSVVTSVTILLVALGTVAMIVPAWRAGRIDPAVTLRTD
jgi:putative ABC transport system permease protein